MNFKPVFIDIRIPRKRQVIMKKSNFLESSMGCFNIDGIIFLMFEWMQFNEWDGMLSSLAAVDNFNRCFEWIIIHIYHLWLCSPWGRFKKNSSMFEIQVKPQLELDYEVLLWMMDEFWNQDTIELASQQAQQFAQQSRHMLCVVQIQRWNIFQGLG